MVALAVFHMLKSHILLVAVVLDNTDKEYFHYCRKFHWTVTQNPLLNIWSISNVLNPIEIFTYLETSFT